MTVDILLPLALVLLTGYYALQTRATVRVMEESIRAQQHPRLVMQVGRLSDVWSGVWIMNEGAGPAIDPFLRIAFIPPPATNRPSHKQEVRVSVITGDMRVEVDGPMRDGKVVDFETLCRDYDVIRLEGEVRDSLGQKHRVLEELKDLRAYSRHSDVGFTIKNERMLSEVRGIGYGMWSISSAVDGLRSVFDKDNVEDDPERSAPDSSGDDEVPF